MNPTELTKSIVATRNELSDAMRRNPGNIYRRLPQAAQAEWSRLSISDAWLNALPRRIVWAINSRIARMAEGGVE